VCTPLASPYGGRWCDGCRDRDPFNATGETPGVTAALEAEMPDCGRLVNAAAARPRAQRIETTGATRRRPSPGNSPTPARRHQLRHRGPGGSGSRGRRRSCQNRESREPRPRSTPESRHQPGGQGPGAGKAVRISLTQGRQHSSRRCSERRQVTQAPRRPDIRRGAFHFGCHTGDPARAEPDNFVLAG